MKIENYFIIQVEAGAMNGEIHDALHAVNMALQAYYPGLRNLTIGGLISTGAHGSSLNSTSVLADSIISIDLVDAKGDVLTLKTDDIRLAAARTSIGVLGVIVRITLPIIPQFKIHMQVFTLPDSIMQEPDFINLIRNATYAGFAWYPRANIIIVEHGQKVSSTIPGDGKSIIFNRDPTLIDLFTDINELLLKYPDLGPLVETLEAQSQSKSPNYEYPDKEASVDVIGWSHHIMCGTCSTECPWFHGMRSKETSYAMPITVLSSLVQDIITLLNRKEHSFLSFPLGGFFFRFGKPTTALLGFGRTAEWFVPEMRIWRPVNGDPIYDQQGVDEIEALMRDKYQGVPHWGKNEPAAFTRAQNFDKKYGSNWQTFWNIQKQLDPNGVFLSPFISNFSN
jgi:FAD/FMN-containing dehydrogenase